MGWQVDPTLTRADRLVGQVLGEVGALPDVFTELEINFFLLRRLLGVRTQVTAFCVLYKHSCIRCMQVTGLDPVHIQHAVIIPSSCRAPLGVHAVLLFGDMVILMHLGLALLTLTCMHIECRAARSRARCRSLAKERFSC